MCATRSLPATCLAATRAVTLLMRDEGKRKTPPRVSLGRRFCAKAPQDQKLFTLLTKPKAEPIRVKMVRVAVSGLSVATTVSLG